MSQKQFVAFAIPSFERRPCLEFLTSWSSTIRLLEREGIQWDAIILGGDPYLPKVRNRLAAMFLVDFPHATDLFFLDDDIGWEAAAVPRLLRRPEDIVFGVYPKKQDAVSFPVELEMDGYGDLIEQNGVFQAHLAPTGFMRVKRHVLERMARCSSRYYETGPDGKQYLQWNIFEARFVDLTLDKMRDTLDDLSRDDAIALLKRSMGLMPAPDIGQFWGEDFWFVERWRRMGGFVWVDPEIMFTHRGSKGWSGVLGDAMRTNLRKLAELKEAAA